MKTPSPNGIRRTKSGYSFAEVLVASALIGLAIGGAVALSASMNLQNEAARTTAIALNLQDAAARIWQLGLDPNECNAIIPQVQDNQRLGDAIIYSGSGWSGGMNSILWGTPATQTLANSMGTLEQLDSTVTIRNPVGGTNRTNLIKVYRPTIR